MRGVTCARCYASICVVAGKAGARCVDEETDGSTQQVKSGQDLQGSADPHF